MSFASVDHLQRREHGMRKGAQSINVIQAQPLPDTCRVSPKGPPLPGRGSRQPGDFVLVNDQQLRFLICASGDFYRVDMVAGAAVPGAGIDDPENILTR